jgi:hypothetical protein
MEAPMLPDMPLLVKCPKCSQIIWIDEAKIIREIEWYEMQATLKRAKYPSELSENDYLAMLSRGKLPREKELYVRHRAWWIANDTYRYGNNNNVSFSVAQENNLINLAKMLDENDMNQWVMKLEILRELGKFDECINLRHPTSRDESLRSRIDFIKRLAREKSRTVALLKDEQKRRK